MTTNPFFQKKESYVHQQNSASTLWIVNHNLGYRPQVTFFDLYGNVLEKPFVTHVSINQIQAIFNPAVAGSARCS